MTSSDLIFNFTSFKSNITRTITILSVLNDKVLLSQDAGGKLSIHSWEGRFILFANIRDKTMIDATWTPKGKIVYTAPARIVLLSDYGKIILVDDTTFTVPWTLSVYNDIIYLADLLKGLFQSADDGFNWNLILVQENGWSPVQVISLTADKSNSIWTIEWNKNGTKNYKINRLSRYDMKSERSDGNTLWARINRPIMYCKYMQTNLFSAFISNDGYENVFLSDSINKAVYVLSENGQCYRQLLSPKYLKYNPQRIAVDSKRRLLYVAQKDEGVFIVSVFKLKYKD